MWLPWNVIFIASYEASKRAATAVDRSLAPAREGSTADTAGDELGVTEAQGVSSGDSTRSGSSPELELSPLVLGICSAGGPENSVNTYRLQFAG